jgi:hypothetical protein
MTMDEREMWLLGRLGDAPRRVVCRPNGGDQKPGADGWFFVPATGRLYRLGQSLFLTEKAALERAVERCEITLQETRAALSAYQARLAGLAGS